MKRFRVLALIVFSLMFLSSGDSPYPLIPVLDTRDVIFRQYLADVESSHRRITNQGIMAGGLEALAEGFTLYSYKVRQGDDFLALAARCNQSHSSLATLNKFAHPSSLNTGGLILLPSVRGIFIPENPETDLERLIAASRIEAESIPLTIHINGRQERFYFIPGDDFTPTERAFFLNTAFRFPLKQYRLTSSFGPRINPVTGNLINHEGLDLAAPAGTEVYATRQGTVTDIGDDPVFGKYVIIRHGGNWVSLYGHLSEILTVLRSGVESGSLIGKVGSTGQSTGPHLHFELRQNGTAQDPGRFLFREGRQP